MNLQPGDALLYYSAGPDEPWYYRFVAWAIKTKTWTKASHVAIVISATESVEARPSGVKRYPIRTDDVVAHLRPLKPLNLPAALAWFHDNADGQRYDFLGLLRFFTIGKQSTDKQFCSELATRFYRAGGFDPFNGQDADLIAPGTFLFCNEFLNVKDVEVV